MRSERGPTARKLWLAVISIIIGTIAGVWHNRQVNNGRPDYVAGAIRAVVSVPARAFSGVSGWFGRHTEWITRGSSLSSENRRLRDQVAALQSENNSLREAQVDLDRLRGDLGFVKRAPYKLIGADIVAMRPDPKFDTMVIDKGSGDGVKPTSVVISKDGVIGRVFEVEPGTSAVLMITDQKSGLGARVQRAGSRMIALCEGDNTPTLSMLGLADTADVKIGDVIVTSGLGGVYPGGLLVGTVSDVMQDTTNGGKTVRVKPQVAFNTLEQVYVIP